MSFDVFFQTCNLSEKTEEAVNPFTGKTMQTPVGETANDEERDAITRLLADAGATAPDENGYYIAKLPDGSSVELDFEGLQDDPTFSGGMAALRVMTPTISAFLYDIASGGKLAMLPAMEDSPTIVTSRAAAARVSTRWPDALVVENPNALHVLLSKGVEAWRQYRDQVTG